MSTAFTLTAGARTHPGRRRPVNEDAILAQDPCFLVADGVGGHDAGAEASRAAIAAVAAQLAPGAPASLTEITRALDRARAAVRQISTDAEHRAGCTLTGVIRVDHDSAAQWYVLNIGDSRTYLHREGQLLQLTTDHSLRSELAEAGDPGATLAPGNVITRALGSGDDRHDSWLLPLEAGSRILVCSDGLTNEVDDGQIQTVLAGSTTAETAADELVRRALQAGGRDNVSAIIIDVDAVEDEDTDTTVENLGNRGAA